MKLASYRNYLILGMGLIELPHEMLQILQLQKFISA